MSSRVGRVINPKIYNFLEPQSGKETTMRKFIMFFVLFALALPAGSAFGQSAVVIINPPFFKKAPNSAISKKINAEIMGMRKNICNIVLTFTNSVVSDKNIRLTKDESYVERLFGSISRGYTPSKADKIWVKYIIHQVYSGRDPYDLRKECLNDGSAMNGDDRKDIEEREKQLYVLYSE